MDIVYLIEHVLFRGGGVIS